jgi:hypothetical protein
VITLVVAVVACVAAFTSPAVADDKLDDFSRVYDGAVADVFLAAAQVAALHWNVTHSDKDTGTISFKTGMNMRTAKGFDMTVLCMDAGNGRTQVDVHPQRRADKFRFSLKEGNRIASTFHRELTKRLALRRP